MESSKVDRPVEIGARCTKLASLVSDIRATDDAAKTVAHVLPEATALFLEIREANTWAQNDIVCARGVMDDAKQVLDKVQLEYDNLLAEQLYLEAEVKKMKELKYASLSYPGQFTNFQQVELFPEEEFMEKAPEELKLETEPRQRMLNRLKFELEQRKRQLSRLTSPHALVDGQLINLLAGACRMKLEIERAALTREKLRVQRRHNHERLNAIYKQIAAYVESSDHIRSALGMPRPLKKLASDDTRPHKDEPAL
ncbi:hypothetical protein EV182_003476 [Spiromyces aspiralis]|uniref:Uncharacterized protein n=1 Tax=Spiromyces aspiralis TaxID=68401 RepID=A0ACC1HST5_9FUNG|nr:hypothetical protein EV182_003476 [Spiromyces aspiralis]